MTLAQRNLRSLQTVHAAFLFAAVAYLVVSYVAGPRTQPQPLSFILGVGVVAISTCAGGIFIRSRFVQPASETLRSNPDDAAAVARWRTGTILSLVFSETVVLYGLALRFIGASWNICGIFYVVGIFLLLAWTPRLELSST